MFFLNLYTVIIQQIFIILNIFLTVRTNPLINLQITLRPIKFYIEMEESNINPSRSDEDEDSYV